MPRMDLSPKARDSLAALPRDPVLLRAVWDELEAAVDDPNNETEPAKLPYPADRRMRVFAVEDTEGWTWNATATFRVDPDRVAVLTLNIARVRYEGEVGNDPS